MDRATIVSLLGSLAILAVMTVGIIEILVRHRPAGQVLILGGLCFAAICAIGLPLVNPDARVGPLIVRMGVVGATSLMVSGVVRRGRKRLNNQDGRRA